MASGRRIRLGELLPATDAAEALDLDSLAGLLLYGIKDGGEPLCLGSQEKVARHKCRGCQAVTEANTDRHIGYGVGLLAALAGMAVTVRAFRHVREK